MSADSYAIGLQLIIAALRDEDTEALERQLDREAAIQLAAQWSGRWIALVRLAGLDPLETAEDLLRQHLAPQN